MATPGATLPHRAVSSIRGGAVPTTISTSSSTPSGAGDNPRTPLRTIPNIPSTFNSPSALRAEDEILIIEFGARKLRVGFAGDAVPKGVVVFSPTQARRVGDFRAWDVGYVDDWRRNERDGWGWEYELWRSDVRGLDLGFVGDRMERGLRDAFNKYLLIDSRPRRMVAVLPSGVPVPLLATTLDTLFNRLHAPSVSLLSSPVACTVSAGVRSALVVDMGWGETVVTGVYEYREVHSSRSVRAGKLLVENTHKLLASALGKPQDEDPEKEVKHILSFEECEEIVNRLVWCKPAKTSKPDKPQEEGLPTVTEQDESETAAPTAPTPSSSSRSTTIRLRSTSRPTKLKITYDQLSVPSETTFFDSERAPCDFDDNELPLPLLIYRNLLNLPMDVRALCMSRIIFTGGCSSVLGLRGRILDEVNQLIQTQGWDPVHGKAVGAYKSNPKLRRGSRQASNDGPTGVDDGTGGEQNTGHEEDGVWVDAPKQEREADPDPIEEQLKKGQDDKPNVQGQLRAIETLGAWSGASLLNLVKVPALATVERDVWREQGVNGASRPSEVDLKVAQRQSMGAGGLMRSSAGANWTLGVWGYL
ncbi:Actin-related protein 10 [Cytospora mali]|uniref:Actin-related protein 10 n=1 Tax=Cytospora mali TaxID=578113 RepID=A0A194V293_CYTMA|nr:Actin-related protein 10 [Valsa mali var. pyri (nom. inval.)]